MPIDRHLVLLKLSFSMRRSQLLRLIVVITALLPVGQQGVILVIFDLFFMVYQLIDWVDDWPSLAMHGCGCDYLLCRGGHEVEIVTLPVCLARYGSLTTHEAIWSLLSESERLSID